MKIAAALQLAVQRFQAGASPEAEIICRQILAVDSNCGGALNLLGIIAFQLGHIDIAIDLIRRAIANEPATADYHSNLGNVLRAAGKTVDAITAYHAALELNPNLAPVHTNLGCALDNTGQTENAIASHQSALAIDPNLAEAHSNLGNALGDLGRTDEAIGAYRAALAIRPNHAEVHFNLATCLLLQGDFPAGWAEYEWRLQCGRGTREFQHPRWRGETFAGRTLLVHAEQGLGDTIQFIRYLTFAAKDGGNVIVECQPELLGLLKQLPGVSAWVATGQSLPPFDLQCSLLSLPMIARTGETNIPPQQPPLSAAMDRVQHWRSRLARYSSTVKVGLVWSGNPGHRNDRNRSIPLSLFTPLARLAEAQFFSLQKGPAAGQASGEHIPGLMDLTADLYDFAETAALIEHLDLVITVDTAVSHLAGAMGKPTWLLLPFAPDWRWMTERSDSLWYPSMRLFRQKLRGDWAEVIDRVATELRRYLTGVSFR